MDTLIDVLKPNLKIVFCGMAAGNRSAELKAYYAGVANKFWKALFDSGLTRNKLSPRDFEQLPDYGIGLTDLIKDKAGNDSDVSANINDIQKLKDKIQYYQPMLLAFVGKEAAKIVLRQSPIEYGMQRQMIGQTKIFVLPSTATTADKWFDISYWKELARFTSVGVVQISDHDGTLGLIDALQQKTKGKSSVDVSLDTNAIE
jgi:TDG/mug DNA glycosylase family protein